MKYGNTRLELRRCVGFHSQMIRYGYVFEDGQAVSFDVDPDRAIESRREDGSAASWTALDYHRCEECPLNSGEHPQCPAALGLQDIAKKFSDRISFHRVNVTVETPERTITKECDVQTGLRSLVGLVLATSGCPVLGELRAMARQHLAFSSIRETLTRTVGFYHLRQYFVAKRGGEPDWSLKGLGETYRRLQSVNARLKMRLESASSQDANLNAIGSLFYTAMSMECSLEENLEELETEFYGDPS